MHFLLWGRRSKLHFSNPARMWRQKAPVSWAQRINRNIEQQHFLGIKFNKGEGQHILKNPGVVHAIVEKVHLNGLRIIYHLFDEPKFSQPWRRRTRWWKWARVPETCRWKFWSEPDDWLPTSWTRSWLPSCRNGSLERWLFSPNLPYLALLEFHSFSPVQYKLKIVPGDVIKLKEWLPFDVCVSNLPYKACFAFFTRPVLLCQQSACKKLIFGANSKEGKRGFCPFY